MEIVDKRVLVREVVACEHLKIQNDPWRIVKEGSTDIMLTVDVGLLRSLALVVEDGKIKLLCSRCLMRGLRPRT